MCSSSLSLQSLPPSEEDQKLAIRGETEEVLQEKCPLELTDVQEKDVREGVAMYSPTCPPFSSWCVIVGFLLYCFRLLCGWTHWTALMSSPLVGT